MTCDQFDVVWYNSTRLTSLQGGGQNRGGMAAAQSNTAAYVVGGSSVGTATGFSNVTTTTSVVNLSSGPLTSMNWRSAAPVGLATRYHTATLVDGVGVVILGGQQSTGGAAGLSTILFYNTNTSTWDSKNVNTASPASRYGHSAVVDASGKIFVYGGFLTTTSVAQSDFWYLDTAKPEWSWTQLTSVKAESRAFHTSTMMRDGKILHLFGQSGQNANTILDTYSFFDTVTNQWIDPRPAPALVNTTESPYTVHPPPSVPNAPPTTVVGNNPLTPPDSISSGNDGKPGSGSSSSSTGLNVPMIAGVCAAGVILLFLIIVLIILLRRRRNRNRPQHYATGPIVMEKKYMDSPAYEEEDKSKQAKAFMIRRPPSVYVVDDQDPEDDIPHPHYKSQYYGDQGPPSTSGRVSPSVAEYELFGANRNTLSTVSSVAERRRYVEEQQRQLREGYESAYNHSPPFEPNSNERDLHSVYEDDEQSYANGRNNNNNASGSTGPRYPRNNSNSRRGQQASSYDPVDDYLN
ncbi:hypothetical protein BGZ54_003145 [Gamsiella multidivaricata]|nr:hypothetical protein BGZ54_003145 [Gamsiella multidivaricata]